MTPGQVPTSEVYVYGITTAAARIPEDLTGVDGSRVRTLELGAIAAVVSDLDDAEDFGRPADLRAHASVLDAIAMDVPVLPMAFGTLAPELEALEEIEDPARQQEYLLGLKQVEGAIQFTLRARYVEASILNEVVAENPEVSRLRDATRGDSSEATYYERIRLGELIVGQMQDKAKQDAGRILETIRPLVRDLRMRETSQAEDVLDVALLVPHEDRSTFEGALEQVAATMHDRVTFRLVGPQAPYDFAGEPR
ncbi:GvpL/GvpF family gas vesicle protein [Pseudactinotalea sp. Z1748]|uniref:GvpL/GvpF family gas vesicle protein n=1 Tax=Pseudactinotalea sp. Z1748 TaxID=3413027 RepID=UPI003C7D5740